MKTKGILTAAFLVAAVLLLQTMGLAVTLDYSGPINSFTGEPVNEGNASSGEDMVPVATGIYYDREERAYIYDLGGSSGGAVSASVMDGMVVNEPVSINASQGLDLRLHRDGNVVEDVDLAMIEEPGRYVLEARIMGDQYVRVLSFIVVGGTTNLVNSYPMPSGFVITNVEKSVRDETGEWVTAQPQWDRGKVDMNEDGFYRVQYECARNGMSYTLQTTVDHTPPTLALENVVNGLARGPVDISDLEEGCKIGITLNGGDMSYRNELTLSGDYEIILQDPAGNLTNYAFSILVYFDVNSLVFFGLVVLLIAGTGIYLYMERKNMRVR